MKTRTHSRRWILAIGAACAVAMMAVPQAQSAVIAPLGVLDTSGINPNTGVQWAVGDPYRFVFISSTSVNPNNAAANDIAYWNTAVQNIANAAGVGVDVYGNAVMWNIVGSRETTDARDNTLTNPGAGSGYAIMAMDGSTVVANDFNDLWSGTAPTTGRPEWTENGDHMSTVAAAVPWSLTGTNGVGTRETAFGGYWLRDTSGGGAGIRQGRNQDNHHWVSAWVTGANWNTTSAFSVYGMSETLYVMPEPSTGLLVALGGLLALLRRRR